MTGEGGRRLARDAASHQSRTFTLERMARGLGRMVRVFTDLEDVPPFDVEFIDTVLMPAEVAGDTVVWGVGDHLFGQRWAPVRIAPGGGGGGVGARARSQWDGSDWAAWEPISRTAGVSWTDGFDPSSPWRAETAGWWHVSVEVHDITGSGQIGVYALNYDTSPDPDDGEWAASRCLPNGFIEAVSAGDTLTGFLALAAGWVPWVGVYGAIAGVDLSVTGHLAWECPVEPGHGCPA